MLVRNGEGSMDMWQRLLERFVPLMDEDVSSLDRRDGVGTSNDSAPALPRRVGAAAAPVSHIRTAYEGRISPLTS